MYKGTIITKQTYNNLSEPSKDQSRITNKYKDEIMEINIYEMSKDHNFFLAPPIKEGSVKSYYILEGRLFNYDTEKEYSKGDLIVLNWESEPFNIRIMENLKILVQAVNDNSFEKAEKLFTSINATLEKIQEKDYYTTEHSHRVYDLTKIMGLELQYTGQRLRNILHAAKYHDIGKIYIEDYILNKPSGLTKEEFEIMKTHATKGKDLITSCFGDNVYSIACQHHERIDGSGYPLGLKSNQITEEAKIIAICDSFDAMTSDRVYKKGKTTEEAVLELKELSGIQYDEALVDLFITKVLPKV